MMCGHIPLKICNFLEKLTAFTVFFKHIDKIFNNLCQGDWDDVNNQSANIGASVFSRDNAVRAGSWAGSITAGVAASATGIGTGSGIALGIAASEAGGALGGYIYDNPESARHPDYETPTGNIINNAFGY